MTAPARRLRRPPTASSTAVSTSSSRAELARLSRRAPALADDHLGAVEASLHQIIDRLLPARVRASARPEALAALFDLEGP